MVSTLKDKTETAMPVRNQSICIHAFPVMGRHKGVGSDLKTNDERNSPSEPGALYGPSLGHGIVFVRASIPFFW